MAHSPYYTQSETVEVENFGTVHIKVLNGDGVIVRDPSKLIVVDDQGRLLAISDMWMGFDIVCTTADQAKTCIGHGLGARVYEIAPEGFQLGPVLDEGGKPNDYPEFIKEEYGFTTRAATMHERIRYDMFKVRNYPVTALFTWLGWTIIGGQIAPIFWAKFRNVPVKPEQGRGRSVAWRIATASVLLILWAVVKLFMFSPFYAALFAVLGWFTACILAYPKWGRRRAA